MISVLMILTDIIFRLTGIEGLSSLWKFCLIGKEKYYKPVIPVFNEKGGVSLRRLGGESRRGKFDLIFGVLRVLQ
jgi:hypothetical protein